MQSYTEFKPPLIAENRSTAFTPLQCLYHQALSLNESERQKNFQK